MIDRRGRRTDKTPTEIGRLIRETLDNQRKSQGWLAREMHVEPSLISRWIYGKHISYRSLWVMCEVLKFDMSHMLKLQAAEERSARAEVQLALYTNVSKSEECNVSK